MVNLTNTPRHGSAVPIHSNFVSIIMSDSFQRSRFQWRNLSSCFKVKSDYTLQYNEIYILRRKKMNGMFDLGCPQLSDPKILITTNAGLHPSIVTKDDVCCVFGILMKIMKNHTPLFQDLNVFNQLKPETKVSKD